MSDERHFELAVQLSRDALKALLLVNGGAATALIALMDKSGGAKDYTWAILLFGAGTVGAVVSACLGYISQLHYANHRLNGDFGEHLLHRKWQKRTIWAVGVTLMFMVLEHDRFRLKHILRF